MRRGTLTHPLRRRALSQNSRGSNEELPDAIQRHEISEVRSRTFSLNSQGSQKEVRDARWKHGFSRVRSRTSSQTSQNTQDGESWSSIPTRRHDSTNSASARDDTASATEGGYPFEKTQAKFREFAENTSGTRDDSGNVPSQDIDGNDSTEVESQTEAETRKLGLAGEATNREMEEETHLKENAEGFNIQPLDTKDQFSNSKSTMRYPASGNAISDIDQVVMKTPVNKNLSNDVLFPKISDSDETSNHRNEARSNIGRKSGETETLSKTPLSSYSNELKDIDSQSQAVGSGPTLLDAGPIHGPVEGQIDPDADKTQDTTETAPFPRIVESKHDDERLKLFETEFVESHDPHSLPETMMTKDHDLRSNSPGIIENASAVSRSLSPWNDRIKGPDSSSQSPGPESITVETNSARDQIQEHLDTEAWLNSDVPLAGNFRAILERPSKSISISPDHLSSPASLTDSIIISPIKSDEQPAFEDEGPGTPTANMEIMKMFAKYKAEFPLQPLSNHQRTSSDNSEDSLLLPPIQGDEEDQINSENLQDASKRVNEEEVHQAASNIFELHSANFRLQNILEEKEARFKLELKRAWAAPRPPPTTQQQRLDKLALKRMESMEIFDEFGDQQRPIHTDPQLVLLETQVHIMIKRARCSFLLDDIPGMYTQANRAAAAAERLRYPPLTARCYFYRGIAAYHHREFSMAKQDFVDSRRCADLYGISSGRIEQCIKAINKIDHPDTAVIQQFPPQRFSRISKAKLTTANRSTEVDAGDEYSPSSTDDTLTFFDDAWSNPADTDRPICRFHSPNHKERSTGKQRKDTHSQPQTPRRPSRVSGFSLHDNPQPNIDQVPNYQPQEESISEESRKDIFEDKAQSLDATSNESPAEADRQEKQTLAPPSMASTEWTLLGSKTSQGTTAKRVPRPYVQPIATSFGTAASVGEATLEDTPVSGGEDLLRDERVRRHYGTGREDDTPLSAQLHGPVSLHDEGIW